MSTQKKIIWIKLKKDIQRYVDDFQLSSPIKLLFVVDFWPVFLLRLEELERCSGWLLRTLLKIIALFLRPPVQGLSGTRIFSGARIGGGMLMHTSVGVIITAKAVIGENATFFGGASVVHKANDMGAGAPIIGDNVLLMSGCKVIGHITVGDNAVIGANAVVLNDVPSNCIAVGIPAVVKMKM